MQDYGLRQLEEELKYFRESEGALPTGKGSAEALEQYWSEQWGHIERLHEAVHMLRRSSLFERVFSYLKADIPLDKLPRLTTSPQPPLMDFREVRASMPVNPDDRAQRQTSGLDAVEGLICYMDRVLKDEFADGGAGRRQRDGHTPWAAALLPLANQDPDAPIPAALGAGEVNEILDDELRGRLDNIVPPLTWREALFHFLGSLQDLKGDAVADLRRREYFRSVSTLIGDNYQHYCLWCDRLFTVDQRHPGRIVCPRCNARYRKRRQRQSERQR